MEIYAYTDDRGRPCYRPDFKALGALVHVRPLSIERRLSWDDYYLMQAVVVARRATCRQRRFGCILTDKNNRPIASGYNGAPPQMEDSLEAGFCLRDGVPSGTRYEVCRAFHAEQNAYFNMSDTKRIVGGTVYIAGWDIKKKELANAAPCVLCLRQILSVEFPGPERIVNLKSDGSIEILSVQELRSNKDSLSKGVYGQAASEPIAFAPYLGKMPLPLISDDPRALLANIGEDYDREIANLRQERDRNALIIDELIIDEAQQVDVKEVVATLKNNEVIPNLSTVYNRERRLEPRRYNFPQGGDA